MNSASRVVGRLAPSPTGLLHLGHARSFLLAYWSARRQKGRLVLRIEDLDDERSAEHFIDAAARDLKWLGIDWDGAPRRQSQGLARIRSAAQQLLDAGLAYPCTCTRSDLRAALSAPQEGTTELRYSGRCRRRHPNQAVAKTETGQDAALRFEVAAGWVEVQDDFFGQTRFEVSEECGDFVILRRNQLPSYQLAVVVDDAADGVTEVVRGEDLLASAARQQLLHRAIGSAIPRWIHVPLVVDADGRRLAKRTDALSLDTLRRRGVSPEAIVGWAARHSGWPELQTATPKALTASFDWRRVPREKVVLGPKQVEAWLR